MIIGEIYHVERTADALQYAFVSNGPQGPIIKVVIFSPKDDDTYNLGFGDFDGTTVKDAVVSNNDDLIKVMNTIASTVYTFLKNHPGKKVYIEPVDDKRSNLYHHIFRRRIAEIESLFHVRGKTEEGWEDYVPGKRYLAFELERKTGL